MAQYDAVKETHITTRMKPDMRKNTRDATGKDDAICCAQVHGCASLERDAVRSRLFKFDFNYTVYAPATAGV